MDVTFGHWVKTGVLFTGGPVTTVSVWDTVSDVGVVSAVCWGKSEK